MWTANSLLLISLYIVEFMVSLFTSISFTKYMRDRFKIGVISLFMLSIWMFFSSFAFQMFISIFFRLREVYEIGDEGYSNFLMMFWTLSHFGTTVSVLLIGILVARKRFDLYITTKREGD